MGLLKVIQSAVKTAHGVTLDLQASIFFWKYVSSDGAGDKVYNPLISDPGIEIHALVEDKQEIVRTSSGQLSQSKTHITILDTAKLLLATNGEGIKENDKIVLSNGETGVILSTSGLLDRSTDVPILTEVYLG